MSADARADDEAAAWFSRLSRRAVTTQTLMEFRDWRRVPENARAYAEVEALWRRAGGLGDDLDLRPATREPRDRRAPQVRPARPLRAGRLITLAGAVSLTAAVLVALAQGARAIRR